MAESAISLLKAKRVQLAVFQILRLPQPGAFVYYEFDIYIQ